MKIISQDMVLPPTGTRYACKLELTISQNGRIDQIATLHAPLGVEIQMTGAIQEIETLLVDHEASAP